MNKLIFISIPTAILIALFIIFYGYDEVVTEERKITGITTKDVSCFKGPGYCMTCGLDLGGGYSCYPKMKVSCPGKQKAKVNLIEIKRTHESGDTSYLTIDEVISVIGECK